MVGMKGRRVIGRKVEKEVGDDCPSRDTVAKSSL